MFQSDAHIVATLFKAHKQAKSTHKISSLYVIDAIAREARQQVKKASKGKQSTSNGSTPMQDGSIDDDDDVVLGRKSKGTYASFLSKIESFLDRLVSEVLTKGPPEHKVSSFASNAKVAGSKLALTDILCPLSFFSSPLSDCLPRLYRTR
jgi:hypothetical protein